MSDNRCRNIGIYRGCAKKFKNFVKTVYKSENEKNK